jgi:cobalamin biosynthesis protein CbiG|tara:strand:- start:423 stop:611 length:189 start_codon:yes stop_codon:yes gene_type:complete
METKIRREIVNAMKDYRLQEFYDQHQKQKEQTRRLQDIRDWVVIIAAIGVLIWVTKTYSLIQ